MKKKQSMHGRRLRDSKTKSGECARQKESENKEWEGMDRGSLFSVAGVTYIA
jgi:hypothetical protein